MAADKSKEEEFPWHLGVYDAHCHPTDTMSSIETIQNMKARVLTVMATRAQDQDLVTLTAERHGIKSSNPNEWSKEECMVPCFGWHPWFSQQMYIPEDASNYNDIKDVKDQGILTDEAKIHHYQHVLQPSRPNPTDEDRKIYLSLQDPTPFSIFLSQTRRHLEQHPYALIGEIGLDRSFRIPESWTGNPDLWAQRDTSLTPGGREGRRLTPFRCSPAHQKKIFKFQLQLAAEMNRAVSVHGVQAHGAVLETLSELWKGRERKVPSKRERKKQGLGINHHPATNSVIQQSSSWSDTPDCNSASKTDERQDDALLPSYPPRICLHSYSGSPSNYIQYLHPSIPCRIYASFSTAINLADVSLDEELETPKAFEDMVNTVPDDLLLVESDLHTAGPEMDRRLEDIVRRVCGVKGWGLEEGVGRLAQNWRGFVFGDGV